MRTIAGLLLATLQVVTAGCAQKDWIDRTLVTVDVTGTWYGTARAPSGGLTGSYDFWFELEQKGATVKGVVRIIPSQGVKNDGPIDGTVAGDVFRFRGERGQVEGEVTISGDEMNGQITATFGRRQVSLRRVDPSARPDSPPR
jgi:hypothetical protein